MEKKLILVFTGWIALVNCFASSKLPDYKSSPENHVKALIRHYDKARTNSVLIVNIAKQRMYYYQGSRLIKTYKISTSKYGIGSRAGSKKTPLGVHWIKKKFGKNAKIGTIFKARRNTGKIVKIVVDDSPTKADYVTSRIMWLQGLERGKNKGYRIDSFKRYIYIHGTGEEGRIGRPASHGCVRMYNNDVIELFIKIPVYSIVNIIR